MRWVFGVLVCMLLSCEGQFVFEPWREFQMGRWRQGFRVRTAQNYYFVALLGRRCASRLVPVADIPTVQGSPQHNKFFMEQTAIFDLDLQVGALRYMHMTSQDSDDVFFFSIAAIASKDIVQAEVESMKKASVAKLSSDWKYLSIILIKE